ncbi:MAG: YeeE/YedE family protein [Hyphomicrobiaceae bacterium]|nr:YeeE/YedE family protein [Hyphomicrobiaceae bacterium]
MKFLPAFLIGLLFGCGILLSGMANPAKVLNFFNVAGHWDPSLAFVMGGALLVTAIGYRLVLAQPAPLLAPTFSVPSSRAITLPLVAGSAAFGIGWGLGGFCPGGLVPVLAIGRSEPLIFFAGLIAGLLAARYLQQAIALKAPAKT